MSVPLVTDMNLSVEWVTKHGWSAVHRCTVGDPSADDAVVMGWARANGSVVFTHDLDFGAMLARTQAGWTS
jgi:predicted nuclease of predicted toxin-antitoxin system